MNAAPAPAKKAAGKDRVGRRPRPRPSKPAKDPAQGIPCARESRIMPPKTKTEKPVAAATAESRPRPRQSPSARF